MKEKKPPSIYPPEAIQNKTEILPTAFREEDLVLWTNAMQEVTKLPPSNKREEYTSKHIIKRPVRNPINLSGVLSGRLPPSLTGSRQESVFEPSSFQIDAALRKRFERGDLPIDGTIDLHGMTLAEAHKRFIEFAERHIRQGARLLLVITGKGSGNRPGSGTGGRIGVIRKNLPLWCEDRGLRPYILEYREAHLKHGGGGASYILLRRQK
ncbi:MAG: Smr/MutS family protein [Alphaproteobacteria bacterium]|nr:Smr/MutS family protein [Alphaproteobacteria bacterium]